MADHGSVNDFIRISQYHLALIAGGFGISGGLIGAWLNHHFSGNRDKRKEFNDVAAVIYKKLIEERRNPSPFASGPTETEFDVFSQHLSDEKRSSFYVAIEKYNKTKNEADIGTYEGLAGGGYYTNPSLIIKEIDNLLEYTKRR